MNLTSYTDYSLRTLIFLALHPQEIVSIQQISTAYGISRNHLVKVANHLARLGYVDTLRGRRGGLRLAKPPEEINIGEVVRKTEPNFHLLECFDATIDRCPITIACRLKGLFAQATHAFVSVLDGVTLGDLLVNRDRLSDLLPLPAR